MLGLTHSFEPDGLHQLDDALETGAHILWQTVELCLGLGTDKAERPLHGALYLFCNTHARHLPTRKGVCPPPRNVWNPSLPND